MKCTLSQFKCVSVIDIDMFLRNMSANHKREDLSSCVVLEQDWNVNNDKYYITAWNIAWNVQIRSVLDNKYSMLLK